jgi:L-fuconolactonase
MIVDGYAHCGISKYQPVRVVAGVMQQAGVNRALLCQHLGEYDNTYLAEVVGDHPLQFACACLVNPAASDALPALKRLHCTQRFRGVRVLAEWLKPHFPLWREALDLGMRLVLFAPNGVGEAVPSLCELLAECPNGKVVVSHLGNPAVTDGADGALSAGAELFQLETTRGVYVLLSGLSMFCEYPHAALRPFITDVIRRFGAGRVMWGSNFPVCGDAEAYVRDLKLLLSGQWVEGPDLIKQISGSTANEFWFGGNRA